MVTIQGQSLKLGWTTNLTEISSKLSWVYFNYTNWFVTTKPGLLYTYCYIPCNNIMHLRPSLGVLTALEKITFKLH